MIIRPINFLTLCLVVPLSWFLQMADARAEKRREQGRAHARAMIESHGYDEAVRRLDLHLDYAHAYCNTSDFERGIADVLREKRRQREESKA